MEIELKGKTDIERAIFLLREIDAFLSFNQQPARDQLKSMRLGIQDFTKHFPECWECGDSGEINPEMSIKCHCVKS